MFLLAALNGVIPFRQIRVDDRVDFVCPAERASVVLDKLSEKIGRRLRALPDVASDVLVIRVQDVPVEALMARIATAAGATWRAGENATYLTGSPAIERERRQKLVREYAARIRTALQARLEAPEQRQPWAAGEALRLAQLTEKLTNPANAQGPSYLSTVDSVRWREPSGRVITNILSAIGSDNIANRALDGQVVYATDPTSMQVGLPPVEKVLERYVAEQVQLADAMKSAGPSDPNSRGYPGGLDRNILRKGDPNNGVGKALLHVVGSYRDRDLRTFLTVADTNQIVITDAFRALSLGPIATQAFAPAGDDRPIPIDALTAEFMAACRVDDNGSGKKIMTGVATDHGNVSLSLSTPRPVRQQELSPALLGWLATPETNDPLRLSAGSLLMTASIRRSVNLVADLDDRCFPASLQAAAKRITPAAWLSSTALQTDHEVTEENGWLTVSLRDIAGARKDRVSRRGLSALLAAMRAKKILTLDAIGQFAQSQFPAPSRTAGGDSFDLAYMKALNPSAALDTYDANSWPTYRLFGALTSDQRDRLAHGRSLPTESLTPAGVEAVRLLVFESGAQPKLTAPDGRGIEPYSEGLITDWTQILPDGVPDGAKIGLGVASAPAAFCLSLRYDAGQIESLTDLARDDYVRKTPELGEYRASVAFQRYVPAQKWTYHFDLHLSSSIALDVDLTDGDYDASVVALSMEQMPADFKSGLDQAYDSVRPMLQMLTQFVAPKRSVNP